MNVAFATVTSSNFITLTYNLLLSLTKINLTNCIYVIHDDLNDEQKSNCMKLYSNILFRKIDSQFYKKKNKYYPKYFKFDLFKIQGHDKIIFIDSDMIFLKSLNNLLSEINEYNIAMVHELHRNCFNTGFIIFDKLYFNDKIYNDLMSMEYDKNLFGYDQQILNKYFDKTIQELPSIYNTFNIEIGHKEKYEDIIGLHYIVKPNKDCDFNRMPENVLSLWVNYHEEVKKICSLV